MKRLVLIAILLVLAAGLTFADTAGGGTFYGRYFYDSVMANTDFSDAYYYGGFGYGTTRHGSRIGGFGQVVFDDADILGAFGGVITGQELSLGAFCLAINLWTGIGTTFFGDGYGGSDVAVAGFGELNVEAGFAPLPWMQIVVYAGLQGTIDFMPVDGLSDPFYSPVFGARLVWGSFRR